MLDNENCNLVTHIKRFLIALSNYEKNKIEIGLLLMAYHKITFDYAANPVMLSTGIQTRAINWLVWKML